MSQKKCGHCQLRMASFDEHLTCSNCRITAGTCNLDENNPVGFFLALSPLIWKKLVGLLGDAQNKLTKEGNHAGPKHSCLCETGWTVDLPPPEAAQGTDQVNLGSF